MNRIFASADVGKKNVAFGIALFMILGTAVFVRGQMRQRTVLKDEMNKSSNLRRQGRRLGAEKPSGFRGWSLE